MTRHRTVFRAARGVETREAAGREQHQGSENRRGWRILKLRKVVQNLLSSPVGYQCKGKDREDKPYVWQAWRSHPRDGLLHDKLPPHERTVGPSLSATQQKTRSVNNRTE